MTSWLRGLWLRARYYLFRARFDREMEFYEAFDPRHAGELKERIRTAYPEVVFRPWG